MMTKRILHVIDTTGPGGAETVFLNLANESKNQGYSSLAIIRGSGWVKSQLESLGLEFIVLDCKGSFNLKYLKQLLKIVKDRDINLIQSHLLGSNVYCSLAGLIARVPVITTFHGSVDISPNERFKVIKLLALRFGSQAIITVTDQLNFSIKQLPILPHKRIHTIYNGIDTKLYTKTKGRQLRQRLSLNDETFLIGCLGNIRSAKNYPLALQTIKILKERGRNIHLAIAGQGNDQQMTPLKDYIAKQQLGSCIHLLGFCNDTQDFLSSLDLFLMTSSSEGHPLAVTQAMTNCLPIVSTRSGVEEIVQHEKQALICEHNPAAIADAIETLIDNPNLAQDLASQARSKALNLYSLDTMNQQYFFLYENLI